MLQSKCLAFALPDPECNFKNLGSFASRQGQSLLPPVRCERFNKNRPILSNWPHCGDGLLIGESSRLVICYGWLRFAGFDSRPSPSGFVFPSRSALPSRRDRRCCADQRLESTRGLQQPQKEETDAKSDSKTNYRDPLVKRCSVSLVGYRAAVFLPRTPQRERGRGSHRANVV